MPTEPNYFGVRLGEALASGGQSIGSGLERKYAIQQRERERQQMLEEQKRREEQSATQQQGQTLMGHGFDNTPEGLQSYLESNKKNRELDTRSKETDIAYKQAMTQDKINLIDSEYGDPEVAKQMGIPIRKNPYKGMSEKMLLKVKPAAMATANKEISALDKKVEELASIDVDMRRASDLLKGGLKTGPIIGNIPGRDIFNKDASEFTRIANVVIPRMRVAGSGTTSDRDMDIYRKSTIGTGKYEDVNQRVIDQTLAINQRIKDKAEFMANYAKVYGDLQGASAEWKRYVNSSPLFSDTGDILPVKPYSEFFSTENNSNSTGLKDIPQSGLTPRQIEIEKLKKELGR
jgi:hypothetical protein